MKIEWVMIRYEPIPWNAQNSVDIALLVASDLPGHCEFHPSEAILRGESTRDRALADHLRSFGALVDYLLNANGGVLDWQRLRQSVPDQGGSVVFSPTYVAEAEDFGEFALRLRERLASSPVLA